MRTPKRRAYEKAYYKANRTEILDRNAVHYKANRTKKAAYHKANIERARAGQARNRQANRDKKRAYDKVFYKANRAKIARRAARWRKVNKTKTVAYSAQYRANNAKKIAACNAAWRRSNRDIARLHSQKTKAKRRQARVVPFTREQLADRIDELGSRCIYCAGPFEHVDHFVPLSRGGAHELCNLVPSCRPCNLRKGNKMPTSWHRDKLRMASIIYASNPADDRTKAPQAAQQRTRVISCRSTSALRVRL